MIFLNVEVFINRETGKFETKYYVKPSNKRLYLHFRSNHPQHVFKSIVYSQALQGIMINSRQEWNIDYLRELREKFLDQDYPLKLVNSEFRRALEVDRTDLLFNKERKKKKKIIAPLIVNYNPGNPDFRKWINQEIDILHQSPDTKKTFPKIDVVTRQNKNIAQKVINSKHWKLATPRNNPPQPPPGNFVKHERNCVTCG